VALGDVNPSSFEAYEGIRILIPGAVIVSVYGVVVDTFAPSAPSPASNAGAAVISALLVGLVLLFLDLPVKSAAYLNPSPGLPNRKLESWGVDPKRSLNLYLALLDVAIPATIRNRSLYMGSIFRIGFEGLYALGLTSIGVFATAAAFPELGPSRGGTTATRAILFAIPLVSLLTLSGAAWVRIQYRVNNAKGPVSTLEATRSVLNEQAGGVGITGLIGIILGLGAFVVFVCSHSSYAVLVAAAVPAIAWAVKYFRGRPSGSGKGAHRLRLSPPAAVLLYAIPNAFGCCGAALVTGATTSFDTGTALAWAGLSLIPAFLIVSRGHERKLNGSFAAQNTWMDMNKMDLLEKYPLLENPSDHRE
jgi:hypothetical protein